MNNKKVLIATLALMLLAGAGATYAYQGDPNVQGPNYSPERHESILNAIESGDYAAWKELMGDRGKITEVITEENFDKFIEMHNLRLSGDIDGANAIREELGLGQGMRRGHGQGIGGGRFKSNTHQMKNFHGRFIDTNGDGICDNLDTEEDEQ